jgi:N-acetylneuraminate epimerase
MNAPRLLVALLFCFPTALAAGEWQKLPAIPNTEGVAGPFAGVSHGALLVAGGANFPDQKPWDGGEKVWHDAVYVLDRRDGQWQVAGKLPRLLGYGVSVSHRESVICVGGSDARRHYADAFRLEWKDGKLATSELPSLPQPVANACGVLVGDTLFIAGGQTAPDSAIALKTVWRIDLSTAKPRWEEVPDFPGSGRILAVAGSVGDDFYLVGGAELVTDPSGQTTRRYLKDAYRFNAEAGWQQLADLPYPIVAAPSPTPADKRGLVVLGGDDGSQVGRDPKLHRGFSQQLLRFDLDTQQWQRAGEMPAARVTVPCVWWDGRWVIPSGEARPGIRSVEVWSWTPRQKE